MCVCGVQTVIDKSSLRLYNFNRILLLIMSFKAKTCLKEAAKLEVMIPVSQTQATKLSFKALRVTIRVKVFTAAVPQGKTLKLKHIFILHNFLTFNM